MSRTRFLLLAGFGGLLLLMALGALDGLRGLRSIQARSDAVRNHFVERNRLRNRIRSGLYSSGTWVRDYILVPDGSSRPAALNTARADITAALAAYEPVAVPDATAPFQELKRQLAEYWAVLDTATHWNEGERKNAGYAFLRDQIYPRRAAMIALTDQIESLDEHQLNARILEVTALFAGLRTRVALTMLLTLGLGGSLATFSTKRILAFECESARHLAEIEQARHELKELSTRLVTVQENERRALSRELHDEVGQTLSALLVTLGNLSADIPEAAATTHMSALRGMGESSLRAVRNMALLLRPSMLDDLGLTPALLWQGREVAKRTGISISLDSAGLPEELPDEYRTSIYRVVQEALHNCEQHAKASVVRVTLRVHGVSLILSIQDDGGGFNPETVRGMGLLGMQERISNLNGTFNVESEPGRGTLIMVRLPLPA